LERLEIARIDEASAVSAVISRRALTPSRHHPGSANSWVAVARQKRMWWWGYESDIKIRAIFCRVFVTAA